MNLTRNISLKDLSLRYGELRVLDHFSLEIPSREMTIVLGPSGCGKTSLLNLISGVLKPGSGSIEGVESRTISYLFQEPRLLPWRTVRQNIDLVLKKGMTSLQERNKRIDYYLKMVGLESFGDYYPGSLSGGMKQRVSMARAFSYPSEILLMDEPFQGLDLPLRLELYKALDSLQVKENKTVIHVTHDIREALLLGDRIILLSSAPAKILYEFLPETPRRSRSLSHPEISGLEQKIYKALSL